MYKEYEGKSRFFIKKYEYKYDIYGNKELKPVFKLKNDYFKYLNDKYEYEEKMEFIKLKEKLENEYKVYGEVDEVDYNRYILKLRELGVKIN